MGIESLPVFPVFKVDGFREFRATAYSPDAEIIYFDPLGKDHFAFAKKKIDPRKTRVDFEGDGSGIKDSMIEFYRQRLEWLDGHFNDLIRQTGGNRGDIITIETDPEDKSHLQLFRILYPESEVVTQQNKYTDTLVRVSKMPGLENSVFAFPLNGALSILDVARRKSVAADRLFPLPIAGTEGTVTGFARIQDDIPDELLDPQKLVIVADDVTDTVVTTVQLALERRKRRGEAIVGYENLIFNIQSLKEQKKQFTDPDFVKQYQLAARLLIEENVVLAPFYSKNPAMMGALNDVSYGQEDSWSKAQAHVLKAVVDVDQSDWIMGGQGRWHYPLLDTKVNGEDMLRLSVLKDHEQKLREAGFGKLSFRVGAGIKSLVVFNPMAERPLAFDLARLFVHHLAQHGSQFA